MTDSFNDRPGDSPSSSSPENRFQQDRPMGGSEQKSSSSSNPMGDLKDKAGEDIRQVREFAEDKAHKALEATTEMASDQKNMVARKLGAVAAALEKVGAELEGGDEAGIGKYARQIGGSAKQMAEDLEGKDMSEVVSIAEDFGRRQPVAFLGLAALAGFAASRFVTASADRRSFQTTGQTPGQTTGQSAGSQSGASQMGGSTTSATTGASQSTPGSYGRYGGRNDV